MGKSINTPDFFVRKLQGIANLSSGDNDAITALPFQIVDLPQDRAIVSEGERPTKCCVVFDGFTCWSRVTAEGQRQILNFHVPGDMPDLQSVHLAVMDSTLSTITPCRVGYLDHGVIKAICRERPDIASALWKMSLIEAGNFRSWVTNIGGRPAYNRVAHLLCEIMFKLKIVGLSDGRTCAFPITQTELSQATGLSLVHINRVLQKLRSAGLIELDRTTLVVPHWKALADVADFDPTYLHQREYA